MRAIIELQALATEMEAEYNQWDEFCMDLEDNVSIDEREARQQTSEQFEPTKVDEAKGKGKAKDPTHHGPTTAHESTEDYFDDLRLYGRVDPHAPASAFGYRKFDPPSPSPFPAKPKESKTSFRRLAPLPEDPDEGMEVDEEAERVERARMNDDASSEAETERVGEQMEVEESMDGDEEMQDVV